MVAAASTSKPKRCFVMLEWAKTETSTKPRIPEEMVERKAVEGVSADASIVHRKRSHKRNSSDQKGKERRKRCFEHQLYISTEQTDLVKVPTLVIAKVLSTTSAPCSLVPTSPPSPFAHMFHQIVSRTATDAHKTGCKAQQPCHRNEPYCIHQQPIVFTRGRNMLSRHEIVVHSGCHRGQGDRL